MGNVVEMNQPTDMEILKEGVMLLDDALACFMAMNEDKDPMASALVSMVYGIIRMAETHYGEQWEGEE